MVVHKKLILWKQVSDCIVFSNLLQYALGFNGATMPK